MKKIHFIYLFYFFIICYMLANTPMVSDDFNWTLQLKQKKFMDLVFPRSLFLISPVEHFTLFIWSHFFKIDNLLFLNLLKIIYIFLSLCLTAKFFSLFLDKKNALFASFIFIFFPTHDATTFWYVGIYATLTIAFYLYSFYLAYNNKLISAFIMSIIASFTSYASIPVALSLFFFFLLNREIKKGLLILIPNAIYSIYYIFMSRFLHIMKSQIPVEIHPLSVFKQFILQIITFFDSVFGPSMWLKIYYSFWQLSSISLIIGIFVIAFLCLATKKETSKPNYKLILSLLIMLFFSFLVFGITGLYPQLAFNLGNRVTIYGSLLMSYLLVLIASTTKKKLVLIILISFIALGISDHWKKWNNYQQKVIFNIKNNQALVNYRDTKSIYVSGSQYSLYGPISHIEFFSEDWTTRAVFQLTLNSDITARTLNKRFRFFEGYLVDTKYGIKSKVEDFIYVYDSQKNTFLKLYANDINNYIDTLPVYNRHWIQLLGSKPLKTILLKLMPRMKYAL